MNKRLSDQTDAGIDYPANWGVSMYQIATMAAVALALAACADERKFYKDGTSQADYNKDAYECERDARMSVVSFGTGIMASIEAKNFAVRCMQAKGYVYR